MRFALIACLLCSACSGDDGDDESFATFQACFDDHHVEEGFSPTKSITICTLDHPIAGALLEFGTSTECVTYVTANLASTDATSAEIQAGCDDYITQKGM